MRRNRDTASVRQRALAEFQAQRFAEASVLFEESADGESVELDRIEQAEKTLRAANTACEDALKVFTKDSFPDDWAGVQSTMAQVFAAQERWAEAAAAEENVLTVHPESMKDLELAESIYHEHLFRFDRAFELNARRVEHGDGELDFVEKHLTTARFEACASRAEVLESKTSDKNMRTILIALRFACLAAGGKKDGARAAAAQLRESMTGLEKGNWDFGGTKYFVSRHAAFAGKSQAWVGLFDALEQGDEAKARTALSVVARE